MIESHYSLNVASLTGQHFCRINVGTWEADAQAKARIIQTKFGAEYKCELTFVECIGYSKTF